MKKLVSKSEQKKKQQRNNLIVGSVLVFLMVFSTIAYSFMDNTNSSSESSSKIIYEGVNFNLQNEYYLGEKYDNKILLSNNPKEIEKNVSINLILPLEKYSGKTLYISSQDYSSSFILSQNFLTLNSISQRVQFACYESQEDCPESYPIKDCSENFIIITYSNESKITSEENCVFISGREERISQLTDLFILKTFGVD